MTPSEQAWVRIELPVTLEASQGFWEAGKKKAFCTGRTDVATMVPGMMTWILDMMCACVRPLSLTETECRALPASSANQPLPHQH